MARLQSIAFARNSVKMTSKGYWWYPVSISAILSTGQGQGQVTKGHQNQKLFSGHATHDLWLLLRLEFKNWGHFAIWPQENQRQVNSRSSEVKFSNWDFWIKNACFGVSLTSGFQKCHFYFCATSRNARNCNLKKWRHQRIRFFFAICQPILEILRWNFAC